ncbi:ABC transporter permease (plasmid) [Haloimpatiens sp. FM7330]|uniref:ABC transporter permease n=1 Tax=Haloimpatiens sp. FM7330 TaxID=3298610 RepID=UPI00362E12CF
MFKCIFMYEFEKFWSKKINLMCFLSIPVIVLLSLKFALETNTQAKVTDVVFSSSMNFPIISIQEMLLTASNIIVLIFFVLSFNEEYRKGNLKMAFSRAISIKKLYLAKFLVLAINIFLILIIHFIISFIVGEFYLPKVSKTALFLKEGLYDAKYAAIYTLKYYFVGYLSLLAFGSIVQFFSIKCNTITATLGLSIGTFFVNFLYIEIVLSLFGSCKNSLTVLKYLCISTVYAQFSGAANFAAGITSVFLLGMFIVIAIFQITSYLSFINEDYLE